MAKCNARPDQYKKVTIQRNMSNEDDVGREEIGTVICVLEGRSEILSTCTDSKKN